MAAAIADSFLVGPSEMYAMPPQHPPSAAAAPSSVPDPFVDVMVTDFNTATAASRKKPPPTMGFTDNQSATYLSSGNPCLDLFFKVVPDTATNSLHGELTKAWQHDALGTLKLVCNLRGVRGYGKNDKEGFYGAASWLHKNHPKTLACNVGTFAEVGYFKDLLEILFRLVEGDHVRRSRKSEHDNWKASRLARKKVGKKRKGDKGKKNPKVRVDRERRVLAEKRRVEIEMKEAKKERTEKRVAMTRKAVLKYNREPDYKYLHDRVSDYFVECLKADLKALKDGEFQKISFAAKWCPSLDSAYDRALLICEPIAKKVFPRESYPEYDGVEETHYAYRVRDRLRKEVLVPLRKALRLPEVYAGAKDWDSIRFSRVGSVAMKTYKRKFRKHKKSKGKSEENKMEVDGKSNVKAGEDKMEVSTADGKSNAKGWKAKVAAGALLPHEIIKCLDDYDDGELAELQWKRLVDDLAKKGKFKNCLAVCDVSGSMEGTPKEVALALGVLVSELSEEPWRGKLITFSEKPKLQLVQGDDLRSKVEFVEGLEPGKNSDLQKVFDLILEVASKGKLKEEQMIKRVFVFSDMEFDDASGKNPNIQERTPHNRAAVYPSYSSVSSGNARFCSTDYQTIVKKFIEKGYGSAIPEIVLWNVRDSEATPVARDEPGVALVSGFSKNLMTLFLEDGLDLSPESVMEAAISVEEYKKLVVID